MAKMSSASGTPAMLAVPTLAIPAPKPKPVSRGPAITPNQPVTRAPETTKEPTTARICSPEPVTAIYPSLFISTTEPPPTPSLSISSSTADPVFEATADVEMSDASSVWSETTTGEETFYEKLEASEALSERTIGNRPLDMDMDVDTPVGDQSVVFQDAHRGWTSMVS